MGDPRLGTRGRGPTGSRSNRGSPGKQTTNRQYSPSAADRKAAAEALARLRRLKRDEYLAIAYATSLAMQGRSARQSVMAWGHGVERWLREAAGAAPPAGKAERVQSFLGGKFLRMYLDHQLDADVVAAAGEEIAESVEFKALAAQLQAHLQGLVSHQKLASAPPDRLALWADQFLDRRRQRQGIAFRNTLNTVVGGITDVDVDRVEYLDEAAAGSPRRVRLSIVIRDVYDFDNQRSGEYDAFRKKLAALLAADKFDEFEAASGAELGIGGKRRTSLDDAAVFASFMYALEKRGWTPGSLPWEVSVPAQLQLQFASHPAAGPAGPARHR